MKIIRLLTFCFLFVFSLFSPIHTGNAADLPAIDPLLKSADLLKTVQTNLSNVRVILTYDHQPSAQDVQALQQLGLKTHTFDKLPMVAVEGPYETIKGLFNQTNLRSIYADRKLRYFLNESVNYIGAKKVWTDLGFTGKEVGVAVIDSGIDATHRDLDGTKTVHNVKIIANNFFTGDLVAVELPNTDTSSGHGTHVASTIGGTGEASNGTYKGVAPDCKLIGIGAGDALFILNALEAFDYALEHQQEFDIEVISNSWGTEGPFDPNDPINVASKLAHDAGITVVFAAGNAGPDQNTLNPYSVAPWVIGVAAGTKDGKLADFSSRGIPGDPLYHPTITAPGENIVAARATTGVFMNAFFALDVGRVPPEYLPYYTSASGTSMATPHISGVVALMKEANPNLTPDQVKDILVKTARPMEGYQEFEVGAGYVDAYAATMTAKNTQGNVTQP